MSFKSNAFNCALCETVINTRIYIPNAFVQISEQINNTFAIFSK